MTKLVPVRFPLLCAFALSLLSWSSAPGEAAGVLFRPEVGKTYSYEISAKKTAEVVSFEHRTEAPIEEWKTIQIQPLAFRSGVTVLDIIDGKNRFRRYVKPNGTVFLAPSEQATELPFAFSLPEEGLETGKSHSCTAQLTVGTKTFPAAWNLTALPGANEKQILLKFAGTVDLPADRVIARKMAVQGECVLDIASGMPISGEWKVKYALDLANKEIAVIRPLWKYRETRHFTLKQKGE